MQQTKVFLAAMVAGVLALGAPAHAGSGDVFAPLEVVSLHGSPCHAQAHRIGGSAALFACEFDPALKVGLAGMPRFEDDVTASLSVLEQRRAYRAPLKRQGFEGTVSQVRLFDGTECRYSDEGVPLAFDGKRLNFTCSPGRFGLVGPLQPIGNTLIAERVVLERTPSGIRVARAEIIPVQAITVDAEGAAR